DRPATTLAGCGPGLSTFASTGAPAHPLDVQQHDRLGLDAQPTTQRELGEGLVDRLPRGTDQLGEFLLSEVVVDVQSVLALLAELLGQLQQCLGDASEIGRASCRERG